MDSVVHFEMPYDDRDRMADFYESAFGWRSQKLGPEMGNYVVAMTTELGPDAPNGCAINGGFFQRPADPAGQHPSVVVAVQDIREAMTRITAAGGTVLGEPMDIPGVGQYVSFRDTEGNRVSALQPLPRTTSS
jgi:uncharacterized protein